MNEAVSQLYGIATLGTSKGIAHLLELLRILSLDFVDLFSVGLFIALNISPLDFRRITVNPGSIIGALIRHGDLSPPYSGSGKSFWG